MINYLKRKFAKQQQKKTFNEYGFELKKFQIHSLGEVSYAQWLHPFEKPKSITESNVSFYKRLSPEGSFIIDIGAHTGDTTVPMALAVGKHGKVLALEPNQYVFRILEENASLNKEKTNIVPQCIAATTHDGKFTFNYSDASFCNGGFLSTISNKNHKHNYTLEVVGKNLQDYLFAYHASDLEKLSLIKVDAEGYDKEILKTIPAILEKYQPTLMIECYKYLNQAERKDLFEVVQSQGYRLYHLENFEGLDNLQELHVENMGDKRHFEMLAVHGSKDSLV